MSLVFHVIANLTDVSTKQVVALVPLILLAQWATYEGSHNSFGRSVEMLVRDDSSGLRLQIALAKLCTGASTLSMILTAKAS